MFNNIVPAWMIGNPFGPDPRNGKYYFIPARGVRVGPFNTREEAAKALNETQNTSTISKARELPSV